MAKCAYPSISGGARFADFNKERDIACVRI